MTEGTCNVISTTLRTNYWHKPDKLFAVCKRKKLFIFKKLSQKLAAINYQLRNFLHSVYT